MVASGVRRIASLKPAQRPNDPQHYEQHDGRNRYPLPSPTRFVFLLTAHVHSVAYPTTEGAEIASSKSSRGKAVYETGPGVSGPGMVVMLSTVGISIALTPTILGLPPASILSDLCLAIAGALWIWSMVGLYFEFDEIKKFLSGIEQECWEYLFIAVVLLTPAGVFLGGTQVLTAPAWVEIPLRVLAVPLFVVGASFVAAALDALFLKPRIAKLTKGRSGRGQQSKAERNALIGGVATATTWVLANASSLLVILERLSATGNQ